jgi:uncharacterized membrane protein
MHNEQHLNLEHDNEFQPNEGGSGVVNIGQNERLISTAAGAFLLSSGLGNLFKNPISALVKTALGGYLLYRGASGHCMLYSSMGKTKGVESTQAVNIRTSLVVNKPKDEVYAFWRKLENLPLFMKHIASVTELDQKHSHWEATIPGNIGKVKWNAEIVKEEPGQMIGWQSIPNSTINNAGKVVFSEALGGQGTELEVVISYHPPAGEVGAGLAKLLNPVFERIVREDVMNFKDYIETKHNAKSDGAGTTGSLSNTGSAGNSNYGGADGNSNYGSNTGSTPSMSAHENSDGNSWGSNSNQYRNP